jgi:glycerophosphoryl diester phosphodiesterase
MTIISFPLWIYSHRGGSISYIENTLSAFRHSASLKVDVLELDVQETKDKQVVIFHDDNLLRMCNVDKRICDLDYKDLPLLTTTKAHSDTRIPLLKELIQEFPDYPMQIDLKKAQDSLIHSTFDLIRHKTHSCLWGSFHHSTHKRMMQLYPSKFPVFFSLPRAFQSFFMYHLGILSWMTIYESAIILPDFYIFNSKGFFNALRKRNVKVVVFRNLNSFDKFQHISDLGADACCTDDPALLIEWTRLYRKKL